MGLFEKMKKEWFAFKKEILGRRKKKKDSKKRFVPIMGEELEEIKAGVVKFVNKSTNEIAELKEEVIVPQKK